MIDVSMVPNRPVKSKKKEKSRKKSQDFRYIFLSAAIYIKEGSFWKEAMAMAAGVGVVLAAMGLAMGLLWLLEKK